MVNELLLNRTQALLGDRMRSILVTGGTGFVGSHLARCLAEAGHEVTVLGRNRYRSSRIVHPRIQFQSVDIRDATLVDDCCAGHELVYHAAALTTPWADRERIRQINVEGTRNVVRACIHHRVRRLVHLSSTSIYFDYTDRDEVQDEDPLPDRSACPYAHSKRLAEEVVQAVGQELNTFTIRARAVFGAGDNALLPRLIEAARDGRLRQIGHGENRVDLTYIDNLVFALILAADRGRAGGVCTITNGEPVKLWELLPHVLADLNISYRGKPIGYPLAYAAASLREAVHAVCPWLGEPKLTRYTVGLLAKNQVFDLAAATRELDYAPIVSMQEGLRRTTAYLQEKDERGASTSARLTCFTTGFVEANRRFVERASPPMKIRFHALVGLIDHPSQGLTLFDTGCAPRLLSLPGIAASLYNGLLPTHTSDSLSIASQLRAMGINPRDVRRVLVSHFHADHIAGLQDFPEAEFIASRSAWEAVRNRKGLWALAQGVLPGLLPRDFTDRLNLIECYVDPGMGPLERCHDLFGDGSVRLFELAGHAAGQFGALIQTGPENREFLVADAAWTSAAIREQLTPHLLTRSFVHSFKNFKRTLNLLHQFGEQFPDVNLIPTHCPEVAARFQFDQTIEERAPLH